MPNAARVGDLHTCPMVTGIIPHVGGPILAPGSTDVEIEFKPAARTNDKAFCVAGGPDVLNMGSPSVLINEQQAVRLGDSTLHGGIVTTGAGSVEIGVAGDGVIVKVKSSGGAGDNAESDSEDGSQDEGEDSSQGEGADGSNEEGDEGAQNEDSTSTLIVHVRKGSENGDPIPEATVTINGPEPREGSTNEAGDCTFESLRPGNYTITARKHLRTPDPASVNTEIRSGSKETTLVLSCIVYKLESPILMAQARGGDRTVTGQYIPVGTRIKLDFGQDLDFGTNGSVKDDWRDYASRNVEDAKEAMRHLLRYFTFGASQQMTERLINHFLGKHAAPVEFEDASLSLAVSQQENWKHFYEAVLGAPKMPKPQSAMPIHEALERVGWDINKVTGLPLTGFGSCSFGFGLWRGNWTNGLGLMLGDVTHIVIYADEYCYDSCKEQYTIRLRYVLYDAFGLDSRDVDELLPKIREYLAYAGVASGLPTIGAIVGAGAQYAIRDAYRGIVAWWQLQHQFGYAPSITKVTVTQLFRPVSTAPVSAP